jgi:AsmA-like C-terminal region
LKTGPEPQATPPVVRKRVRTAKADVRQSAGGGSRTARIAKGTLKLMAKVLLPVLMLAGLGLGLLYVRLLNGPVSLQFLAEPIARSIGTELPGYGVVIEDALVRLTDSGGMEFRLRNVRFTDSDNRAVAVAPLAAINMSMLALKSGRIAPARIVLIEPRLLLSYSEQGGLNFRVPELIEPAGTQSLEPAKASPTANANSKSSGAANGTTESARLDLGRLIAERAQRARQQSDAVSFLRAVGVRNAKVALDFAGSRSIWSIPEADLDLSHGKRRSTLAGRASVASATGPWTMSFRVEDAEKEQTVSLQVAFADFVPRGLMTILPDVAGLDILDAPLQGEAQFTYAATGALQVARAQVELGRGTARFSAAPEDQILIESGRLLMHYDPVKGRVEIDQAGAIWGAHRPRVVVPGIADAAQAGQSRVTLKGQIAQAPAAEAADAWDVDLRSTEGVLDSDDPTAAALPLEALQFQGRFTPANNRLRINKAMIRAGGTEVSTTGELFGASGTKNAGIKLDGKIGAASVATAKVIWPLPLATKARAWVLRHVTKGRLLGGNFQIALMAGDERDPAVRNLPASAKPPHKLGVDDRISLTLEAADAQFFPARGVSAIDAPRVLVRIEGDSMEIAIPDGATQVLAGAANANRRVTFKAARLTAVDLPGPRTPTEIVFRAQGGLQGALDILDQEKINLGPASAGLSAEGIDGKVDAQIKISLPLMSGIERSDIKVEAKARLTDGRAKNLAGAYDINGATITLDTGDKAIEAKGDLLIGGVSAKLAWQRIFGVPDDKQPPLRVTAKLDNADRTTLGMDINSVVQGDVPVELTVTRGAKGETQAKVRADLSAADMVLEELSWRKPPGRSAVLQFDIGKDIPTDGTRGPRVKTVLQNFKLVGDDIAVDGWLGLDAKSKPVEFHFPDFSLNVVSRLDIGGTLRPDNVWDIKARGQTFDGRELFKSLFSVGQVGGKVVEPPRKDQPGADIKAEIETIIGQSEISMRNLKLQAQRRGGKLTSLNATAGIDGGKPLELSVVQAAPNQRKMVATSDNAGQVFRLIGFYPNMNGGQMRLEVNLDGQGTAEKTGLLFVRRFAILGDAVVGQVLQSPDEVQSAQNRRPGSRGPVRETIDFDTLQVPFKVGHGQFILDGAQVRGPLLGASITGKADLRAQRLDLGGSYIPLQGLNAALAGVPLLGQLLTGPKGEGIMGVTFAVQGPMSAPQVLVNPLSMLAPGPFRDLFQMSPQNTTITPRDDKPAAVPIPRKSSVGPAVNEPVRAPTAPTTPKKPIVKPEVGGSWSTGTNN